MNFAQYDAISRIVKPKTHESCPDSFCRGAKTMYALGVMKSRVISCFMMACAACCALCGSPIARAQCFATYEVEIILPDCDQPGSSAWAIAENGDIAGSYSCFFGNAKAFGLFGSEFVTLPMVSGFNQMSGHAINPFMEIVGPLQNTNLGSPNQAFLFTEGQAIALQLLDGANGASANSLRQNELSLVVGYTHHSVFGNHTAVIWESAAPPIPLQLPISSSEATDINEEGAIIGRMGGIANALGFVFENGKVTTIQIPLGYVNVLPQAINNKSQICGRSGVINHGQGTQVRAWMWEDGAYTFIDPLPGYKRALARDINDCGVIVGLSDEAINSSDPNNPQPAFIWKDGVMQSLITLVESPIPNLRISTALGINNAGQIAASGKFAGTSQGLALRLNPLPSATGDSDFDCDVDVDDLLAVINNWAATPAKGSSLLPAADFNRNGIVNVFDLLIVIDNWTM